MARRRKAAASGGGRRGRVARRRKTAGGGAAGVPSGGPDRSGRASRSRRADHWPGPRSRTRSGSGRSRAAAGSAGRCPSRSGSGSPARAGSRAPAALWRPRRRRRCGSRPPASTLSYRSDPQTHKLVPYPDEAPHLREIFRPYTDERLGTRAVWAAPRFPDYGIDVISCRGLPVQVLVECLLRGPVADG